MLGASLKPRCPYPFVSSLIGYELLSLYQVYHGFDVSGAAWHKLLTAAGPGACSEQCCGVCASCLQSMPRMVPKPIYLAGTADFELHALEAMPSNQRLLASVVRRSALPAVVNLAAVGGVRDAGRQFMVRDVPAGSEAGTPWQEHITYQRLKRQGRLERQSQARRESWVAINVTTIDAYMADKGLRALHHVVIDIEGCEADAIAGMHKALQQRRVELFEFEHSERWGKPEGEATMTAGASGHESQSHVNDAPHTLRETLELVRRLGGYTCFWHDVHGNLAEASPPCWRDELANGHPQAQSRVCVAARSGGYDAQCQRCEAA